MFKIFEIENNHDVLACYRFPKMLPPVDVEQWWKHWRKSSSDGSISYPLIFYQLGELRSTLVKTLLRLPKVIESVNTIRDVANNNCKGEKFGPGEMDALSALFFRMTFVNVFFIFILHQSGKGKGASKN